MREISQEEAKATEISRYVSFHGEYMPLLIANMPRMSSTEELEKEIEELDEEIWRLAKE